MHHSTQRVWKTNIAACLQEFKHTNIPKSLLLAIKSSGGFCPRELKAAEAPRASPHSLLAPQSGWQVCDGDASTALCTQGGGV